MKQKIITIWKYMDEQFKADRMRTYETINKALELGISREHMDRVFQAWACTLSPEPPAYLFEERLGILG